MAVYALVQNDLSCVMRKPVFGVSDQVDTNQAVQAQIMARGLKVGFRK